MTHKIAIFDTTLRDGEQAAGVCFDVADKLAIARKLEAMRVDVIEAGFPAASEAELAAVSAVAAAVGDSTVCALARAVPSDVEAAARALETAAQPRMHVFINSSDVQLRQQLRKERDQVLAQVEDVVAQAHAYVADVEFSPMDATRADPGFLAELVRVALAAGACTVNLPDTVGCALPDQIADMIRRLRSAVPELVQRTISFHGQDDLGLATANSLAAIAAGAGQVEVAVNGIGERAGNTAFEEVVIALKKHGPWLGVETDVDATGVYPLSRLVAERSGMAVSDNKAIVGGNAFRHASGIHQDGVLKARETYECVDPAWVGHPVGTEIVLGKLSGRSGFLARAAALGYELAGARAQEAFDAFQVVADRGGVVGDDQIRSICASQR